MKQLAALGTSGTRFEDMPRRSANQGMAVSAARPMPPIALRKGGLCRNMAWKPSTLAREGRLQSEVKP